MRRYDCKNIRRLLTALLVIIAAIYCACPAAQADDESEDITTLFKQKSMLAGMTRDIIDDADLFSSALEVEEGSFPAEAAFALADKKAPQAVLTSIALEYPEGTPEDKRVDSVEVWVLGSDDSEAFRRLIYKGNPGTDASYTEITLKPNAVRQIIIRFFSAAGGGAAVLPRIAFQGYRDASSFSRRAAYDEAENFVLYHKNKAIGTGDKTREPVEDGYSYNRKENMKISFRLPDMDKAEEETIETSCSISTDENFFAGDLRCACPGNTRIRGERRMFEYKYTLCPEVDDKQSEYAFEPKNDSMFPIAVDMIYDRVAADGLAVGAEHDYSVIETFSGKIYEARATVMEQYDGGGRDGAFAVWLHDKDFEGLNQLALIDSSGKLLRKMDMSSGIERRRVDSTDDIETEPLIVDYEQMLEEIKASIKNFIELPDGVKSARLKLHWNGVPPEYLTLDSARQTLVSFEETQPGEYTAEFDTRQITPDDAVPESGGPLTQSELNAYLLGDETVQTDNEDLIKIAKDVTKDEQDPLEKAKLIFNWIIHNVKPYGKTSYFAPPASRIIHRHTGDCKHIAVLFATLARISGIPTRFAFGQRYLGGTYGYHVWNQIYVNGGWLDVDASDFGFYPGALHLQLTTSESLNEKAHLGIIMGADDPEILDYESADPVDYVIKGDVDTELTADHYSDAFFNCTIHFPEGFDHKVVDLGVMRVISLSLPKEPLFHANIVMLPIRKGKDVDMEEALEGIGEQQAIHLLDLFGGFKNMDIAKAGETSIDGRKGMFGTADFKDNNNRYVHMDFTWVQADDRLFVFSFVAPDETFGKYNSKTGYVKKSIKIY